MENIKEEINRDDLVLALNRLRIGILSGRISQSKRSELMDLYDNALKVLNGKGINKDSAYDVFAKEFGPKLKTEYIPRTPNKNKKDSGFVHPHWK